MHTMHTIRLKPRVSKKSKGEVRKVGRPTSSQHSELKNVTKLYDLGFNVIPLNEKDEPLLKWSTTERVPRDELVNALEDAHGIAIVAGERSPCESEGKRLIIAVFDNAKEKRYLTLRIMGVQSAFWVFNGTMIIAFCVTPEVADKYFRRPLRDPHVRIVVDSYVPIPPSVPDRHVYTLTEEDVENLMTELKLAKELTDAEIRKLVKLLKDVYKSTENPSELTNGLAGWMARANVDFISAVKVVRELFNFLWIWISEKTSAKEFFGQVAHVYRKLGVDVYAYSEEFEAITDLALSDVLLSTHVEGALGRDAVVKILIETYGTEKLENALNVIEAIDAIIGKPFKIFTSKATNDALTKPEICIDFDPLRGYCKKAVVITKDDVEVVTYKPTLDSYGETVGVVPSNVKTVLNGRIEKVTQITFKGITTEERLLKLTINGVEVFGTIDEIADKLKAFNLNRTYKDHVIRLLLDNAVVEETFCCPGPWVVNDRVETADYRPGGGDVARGIEAIADVVNAFGNPHKAVTVLSYGIIAWAKHYFVERFGFFPHLVVVGSRTKDVLADVLRMIYNLPETELPPKSVPRLKEVLARTTVPGLIVNGDSFVNALATNDKLSATLSESTTSNVIDRSPAVRSLIIFTGSDVGRSPVHDKLLTVHIAKDEGPVSPPKKLNGKDVGVMREVLRVFGARLNEIGQADVTDYGKFYIELGYSVLKEIAEEHGVTLPEPSLPLTAEDDVDEIVVRAFKQYLDEKVGELDVVKDPKDPKDALDRYGFFVDTKHGLIIFGTTFLTQFGITLVERYGLPKMSWKKLAEVLGLKRTRITRYGVLLNHVFEVPYAS